MNASLRIPLVLVFPSLLVLGQDLPEANRLRGLRLLAGYTHSSQQGFDSLVGDIRKEDGLRIQYEIGRVVEPGQPRLGGDFRDRARLTPKDEVLWYREQVVAGEPVHVAYRKDKVLLASFPRTGMNFRASVGSMEQLADSLLMILTYPEPVGARTEPRQGGVRGAD